MHQSHRLHTEARAENAIQGCGRAAALKMAEHRAARFFAGARSDFARDDDPDSAVDDILLLRIRPHHLLAVPRACSFRDDD